jgi:multidrug efflux pump subunit AcrA (membrane-fusion protein)
MIGIRSVLVAALLMGCGGEDPKHSGPASAPAPITNRVLVPAAVRQNLGITFAKVEERTVAQTLRLAGHFTVPPSARFPHHTPLAGVVQVHVAPLETVEKGHLLVSVSSPEMLKLRHELHVSENAIGAASDALKIMKARLAEANGALEHLKNRNSRLKSAKAPRAELLARQATEARRVAVLTAERDARRHELTRARHSFEAELLAFSLTLGRPLAEIRKTWESIEAIEVRSAGSGVVAEVLVSTGAWIEAGAKLVELRDPTSIWFTARVLNSDMDRLVDGQRVEVLPPGRLSTTIAQPAFGVLRLGVTGDLIGQTVPGYVMLEAPAPKWARPGTTAFADVTLRGGTEPEIAIPTGALVRDGLQDVFFRRDPADPDKVIRVEADRGPSDARWTVVYAGVAAGDEVVVDGAYELKLASTAKPAVTGHFHADGTFHAGDK